METADVMYSVRKKKNREHCYRQTILRGDGRIGLPHLIIILEQH